MSVTAETVGLSISGVAVLPVPVGRLSVEKYHEMVRQGILTENDRMDLGWNPGAQNDDQPAPSTRNPVAR